MGAEEGEWVGFVWFLVWAVQDLFTLRLWLPFNESLQRASSVTRSHNVLTRMTAALLLLVAPQVGHRSIERTAMVCLSCLGIFEGGS